MVAETGGSRNRTGGVNVSLSSPDGHVIGGAVGGRLVASKPVQVLPYLIFETQLYISM